MIAKTLTTFIVAVNDSSITWKECREYEGDFESDKESAVFPPSAFVEITGSFSEKENYLEEDINLRLLVVTSHIRGISSNADGALDIIDTLKTELHDTRLMDGDDYVGYLFYKAFNLFVNLPGLKVYEMNFVVKK